MNSLRSPKCTFDLQEILDLSEIQIEKPATNSKVVDMDTKESLKPSMNQKPKPQFHFMKTFETCTEPTKPTEHQPQKPQQPRCQFHFMQDVTNTTETKPMDVNPTRTKKTKKSKKPDEQNILFERFEEQQRKKQTKRNMGNSSSYKKPCSASRKRHYTRKEPPYPYPRRKRYNDYRSELSFESNVALAVYEILFPQLLDIEHYRQCYLKNRAKKRQAGNDTKTASTDTKRSKLTFFKRVCNFFKNDKVPESESVEPTIKSEVLNDAMTNTASEVQSSTEDMNKLNDETKESKSSVENVEVKENTKHSKKWKCFKLPFLSKSKNRKTSERVHEKIQLDSDLNTGTQPSTKHTLLKTSRKLNNGFKTLIGMSGLRSPSGKVNNADLTQSTVVMCRSLKSLKSSVPQVSKIQTLDDWKNSKYSSYVFGHAEDQNVRGSRGCEELHESDTIICPFSLPVIQPLVA